MAGSNTLAVDTSSSYDRALSTARQQVSSLADAQWQVFVSSNPRLNAQELATAIHICKSEGLDPIRGEIIFDLRTDKNGNRKLLPITSIHVQRSRVAMMPGYRGISSGAVHRNDEFLFDRVTGEVTHRQKAFDRGPLMGAWATIEFAGERIYTVWLPAEAYLTNLDKAPIRSSMPDHMIEKTAEAMVIRKGRGNLSLYVAEEFGGESAEDGTVRMARTPSVPKADPDADAIALHVTTLSTCKTVEALDKALPLLREAAEDLTPSARRLLATHVARRKVDLGWKAPPCPGCGDPVAPGKTTCANCEDGEVQS